MSVVTPVNPSSECRSHLICLLKKEPERLCAKVAEAGAIVSQSTFSLNCFHFYGSLPV